MRRYGFETNTNMVHGLYGPDAVVEDFLTVMYRIKALGFNAIRTPISFLVRGEARSSYVGSVHSGRGACVKIVPAQNVTKCANLSA